MGSNKLKSKSLPITPSIAPSSDNNSDPAPVRRKRGRPRKYLKEEPPVEEHKAGVTNADNNHISLSEAGKKRGRVQKSDESCETSSEQNGLANSSSIDEPVKPQVVKREGSRRKGEPRRAAGVDGK